MLTETRTFENARQSRNSTLALISIALAIVLLHVLTNGRYGFHRDELQVLSDARHLDWGFVPYPPLTPFVQRLSMGIFGLSMRGLRMFSVIAQAAAIVVTGMMARRLGGGRLAIIGAALAVALSPLPIFEGTEFQYTTFDFLWWTLTAYFMIRLLESENPRWWLAIGATIGLGLQTKYTMMFLIAGIMGGVLLTRVRRFLQSPWVWGGMGLALLIFAPNLWWQIRHGFISLHFLQHIHIRDVRQGRTSGFLRDQFLVCTNLFAAPLWIAGIFGFLRSPRYRLLAWMYFIPLLLFLAGKGRGYYLGGAYPVLMATGATMSERWLETLPRLRRRAIEATFFVGLAALGIFACALILPIASSGRLMDLALKNNGDLREEIGWDELVGTVAAVRNSLPPEQQKDVGVVVGNYGEQGAIEILGPAYHLPVPISGTNSAWLRGYPVPPPSTLIVLGLSHGYVDKTFVSCRVAGYTGNSLGVQNEESEEHQEVFVCGGLQKTWPEFWKTFQNFG